MLSVLSVFEKQNSLSFSGRIPHITFVVNKKKNAQNILQTHIPRLHLRHLRCPQRHQHRQVQVEIPHTAVPSHRPIPCQHLRRPLRPTIRLMRCGAGDFIKACQASIRQISPVNQWLYDKSCSRKIRSIRVITSRWSVGLRQVSWFKIRLIRNIRGSKKQVVKNNPCYPCHPCS